MGVTFGGHRVDHPNW